MAVTILLVLITNRFAFSNGSLLHAIGLPDLITHSLQDYEDLAVKLVTTPALLARNRIALLEME